MDGKADDVMWKEVEGADDSSTIESKSTDDSDSLTWSDLCTMALSLCFY